MYAALVNGKPVTTLLKELLLLGCARDPLLGEHFSADLDGRCVLYTLNPDLIIVADF
jgi:hypothetical protein